MRAIVIGAVGCDFVLGVDARGGCEAERDRVAAGRSAGPWGGALPAFRVRP